MPPKPRLTERPPESEIIFSIDVFTPETMPIDRIAKYIERFAAMVGHGNNVHLMSVDSGSCALRSFADEPAIPKIRERVHRINEGTAPLQAQRARTDLDDLLAEDNAIGQVLLGGQKVIEFPGRNRNPKEEIGPFARPSTMDGSIWSMGGKDETINVQLRNRDLDLKCIVSLSLARKLTSYLFGQKIRLTGIGQWYRTDGRWYMKSLIADDFVVLDESRLEDSLDRIKGIMQGVSPDEFLDAMAELRHG